MTENIIGNKFVGLDYNELELRAFKARSAAKNGMHNLVFWSATLVATGSLGAVSVIHPDEFVIFWVIYNMLIPATCSMFAYRGWLVWYANREKRDLYETLMEDKNVLVTMGFAIRSVNVGEIIGEAEGESDGSDRGDEGSLDREGDDDGVRGADVPELPNDDRR